MNQMSSNTYSSVSWNSTARTDISLLQRTTGATQTWLKVLGELDPEPVQPHRELRLQEREAALTHLSIHYSLETWPLHNAVSNRSSTVPSAPFWWEDDSLLLLLSLFISFCLFCTRRFFKPPLSPSFSLTHPVSPSLHIASLKLKQAINNVKVHLKELTTVWLYPLSDLSVFIKSITYCK